MQIENRTKHPRSLVRLNLDMKVAFFSECYTPVTNGVVTSLRTLREALRSNGHTIYLFAPGAPQPDDDEHIFRLKELPFPRHPYHFARPFTRPEVDFRSLGVELVHCHHPFTVGRMGAELARKYDLPMVYTAHTLYDDMAELSRSQLLRKVGPKAARGVIRRFCDKASFVIVPSRHTLEALNEDGVLAKFSIIPSGVPPMDPRPGARERIRKELGIGNVPLLLQVSRLGPEKRVDLLLRSVAMLKERQLPAPASDFHLAIVGDGQCREDLEELTKQLGIQDQVTFAGYQPFHAVGDWYDSADIFVLSSPDETQGLTLVEAMAAGLPCIAINHGGPAELVRDGETGLLAEFTDSSLTEKICALLCDPALREQLGNASLELSHLLTPEKMANSVLEVYQEVLNLRSQKMLDGKY